MTRRILQGGIIAALSWGIGYAVTKWVAAGTSAASAYAVLVGWWLTAYVSSLARLPVLSVIPLSCLYMTAFLTAQLSGRSWFYRDIVSLSVSSSLAIGMAQSLVVISPILFD